MHQSEIVPLSCIIYKYPKEIVYIHVSGEIMRIGEKISNSIEFTNEALFGKWVRWIMLVIASIVMPIMYGYTVRIMRGVQPAYEEESFFSLFIDGVKLLVIYLIYMIIPLIAFAITIGVTAFNVIQTGGNFTMDSLLPIAGALIAGGVITIIIGFIFMLLNIIGSVRFARTQSMKEAFAFGEIFSTIGKIGWLNYIFSLIVLFIVVFLIVIVVTIVEVILGFIPILGLIIGWVISLFLGPYISIMMSRYYSLLYDEGM
ncbi:hypothetical protein DSECCO2_05060 [anaerobic digester metagenome]